MATPDSTPAETAENWPAIGQQLFAGALESFLKADLTRGSTSAIGQIIGDVLAIAYTLTAPIGIGMAKGMAQAEDLVAPAFADMAAVAVSDVFNIDCPRSTFEQARGRGARAGAGAALGKGLMQQLQGTGSTIEPSSAGAERFVAAMGQMAIEDWFKGWFFEVLSSLVPQLDIGKIEAYGALGDKVTNVLGLGRISTRVLRPIAEHTIVTPLNWKLNKTYRPRLLTPAEVVRQSLRGKWDKAQATEELARQGYSDNRIEALFNAQRKVFSPGDVRQFVGRGHWDPQQGLQHLRDQGYDQAEAEDALRLEGLNRFEQLEGQEAALLIGAYASRDIDAGTFGRLLGAAVSVPSERALYTELAELRRAVTVRRLTLGQVEAMVKSGVLSVRDYRMAAEREGYPAEDVLALELQLRWELDREKQILEHRAEALAARALELEARAAALQKRKLELEGERALARLGSESDLERAVVRGKIGIDRLEQVYRARYDPDTAAALVALVEDDRLAYLARESAADEARKRGARRNIDVGSLERAYVAKLLNPSELRGRLEALGFGSEDADLLTATIVAREAERLEAEDIRREASTRAKARAIDLGRYEQLVRRGARTLGQYAGLLESLGFTEASVADMSALLQLQINADAEAREARERAERELRPRGLSLEQIRRAVLLGVRTEDDFQRFLIQENFTTDAQLVLLAELRADVAEAESARARREVPTPGPQATGISVSTVRRAAQLGVVTVQAYVDRLTRAGYSAEDIDLEIDLLLFEIQDAAAAREKRSAPAPVPAPPGPSLAELERAVRAGVATLDQYLARAISLGRTAEDAGMIAAVLARELETFSAARKRREQIAFELAAGGVSLAELEAGAKSGELTIEAYAAQLAGLGYSAADGEMLGALLALEVYG